MKMQIIKRQWFLCVMAVLICLLPSTVVLAAADDSAHPPRLVDEADYLTDSQESELSQKLDEISERQQNDVVVVTIQSLEDKDVQAYADDYFDYNGYGYGTDRDGILLLVSKQDRKWHLSTRGYGITAFTDDGLAYMETKFKPQLSKGKYAEAFSTYAQLCDDFITQAKTGKPYTKRNLPKGMLPAKWILISLVVGLIIALIAVGSMQAQLKTVHQQTMANEYVKKGSMNVSESRDVFLYRTVDRRVKPKENSSGGGSSTHRSSSGATHGGRSGSF